MKKQVLLLLMITLLLGGCGSTNSNIDTASPANQIKKPGEIYIMAGKIEANEEISIVSKIQARVSRITVDTGSRVKQGEPLIYLDVQDVKAQEKQAEAGVKVAQAALNKIQKGVRPEQLAQARAVLEGAKVSYENAKNNLRRMEQLRQDGGTSIQQVETAQGQFSAAETQMKSAQEQLNMLSKGETTESVQVVQAQLKQAQSTLEYVRTQLNNGVIIAPVAGVVSIRNVDQGELASLGQPLVTVVSSDRVYINANVPPRLISKLKVGQDVIIMVSEVPDRKFPGQIDVISPAVDPRTKSILVKVTLKNPEALLKPGMIAEISLKR